MGKLQKISVEFEFKPSETLNSNRMPNSSIVKSQKASKIRRKASEVGIGLNLHDDTSKVVEKYQALRDEAELALAKSRAKKKMRKANVSELEIEKEISRIEENLGNFTRSSEIVVEPLFNFYKVTVLVKPPTRISTDPANFYPTVKALIDGLTDVSWWDDDSFSELGEIRFRYGGLSGVKGAYKFVLEIEEISPNGYVTKPVLV